MLLHRWPVVGRVHWSPEDSSHRGTVVWNLDVFLHFSGMHCWVASERESQDAHVSSLLCKICFFNICRPEILELHDEHFSCCWTFVRRFHWSQVVSPHKEAVVRKLVVLFCGIPVLATEQTIDLPVNIKPMMRMWWHCCGKIALFYMILMKQNWTCRPGIAQLMLLALLALCEASPLVTNGFSSERISSVKFRCFLASCSLCIVE